jgi:hypothetical protein
VTCRAWARLLFFLRPGQSASERFNKKVVRTGIKEGILKIVAKNKSKSFWDTGYKSLIGIRPFY